MTSPSESRKRVSERICQAETITEMREAYLSFGALMREARIAAHWSQKETARRIGCSLSHYRGLEAGNNLPSYEMARKLDKVLGQTWPESEVQR